MTLKGNFTSDIYTSLLSQQLLIESQLIRKLVAKGFIKESGRSELPGRPILYTTTNEFLDYFGLSSKEELPKFEKVVEEEIEDDTDLYHSKYVEE